MISSVDCFISSAVLFKVALLEFLLDLLLVLNTTSTILGGITTLFKFFLLLDLMEDDDGDVGEEEEGSRESLVSFLFELEFLNC